jgi:hypothetical protein
MLQIKQPLGMLPELGATPPDGQPTKLHALRLRQMQDLLRAYGQEVPKGMDTKDELLPYMTQLEKRGVFRGTVVSEYYLLHAQLNSDSNLSYTEKEELEQRLVSAAHKEFPEEKHKHNLFFRLQQQCKAEGLDCMGKSVAKMRQMLKDAGKEPEDDQDPPSLTQV